MTLSPQFLDELRGRTLLSALVGRSVKLQKAGREFRACCPFHNEKTPSFYVNDDKAFYHCFGCGAHGDAIRFLTDAKGLPFMDAVKELAAAAGMEVPAADPRSQERAERTSGLFEVTEAAARWFAEQLGGIGGGEARAYLERRGVSRETVAAFAMGFAPDSRGKLKAALAAHGNDKLIETGLLISTEDKEPYDRFRGRLMIPIRDARGRVIAFGGRIIGAGEPKYLNSPETPLFDKGRTLFNLDRAAAASRKAGRVIVVEGYMDVIMLDQAGIGEAVAPLGTALTEGQLERLWRLADVPILCFDGDSAGQKAAIRAALRALPMIGPGRSLRFVSLPTGQDPDDIVRDGGREAIEVFFQRSEALVDRLWRHEVAAVPLLTPEDRASLGRRLRDHVRTISDAELRNQYLGEYNQRLKVLFESLGRGAATSSPKMVNLELIEISKIGIDQAIMAPAVFSGLIRYPRVISDQAERIAALKLELRNLRQLREVLLDAALGNYPLEGAALLTILQQAGLNPVLDRLRKKARLAFSFLRSNAGDNQAIRDLNAVIERLAERAELDTALKAVTAKLSVEVGDVANAAAAEQMRLMQLRLKADEELMALASENDGAAF